MAEPVSTAAGAGAAKAIGLGTIFFVFVVAAIAIVLMMIQTPRNAKEWAIGIITTIIFSAGLGATVIRYLEIGHWVNDWFGVVGLAFIIFSCGLPGWFIVRLSFNFMIERQAETIKDLIKEVRNLKNDK
nr:DUF2304 family protein [Acinetobacter sp. Marseille-Q1620]